MKKLLVLCASLSLVGCVGGSLKPTTPKTADARKACPVTEGVVIDTQDITIEGNVGVAQAAGAALGGFAANDALKGKDDAIRTLATVAGAAVGTLAGDIVGNAALNKAGQEVVVQTNIGAVSVIQQKDRRVNVKPGDLVWVIGDITDTYRYRNRKSNTNCTGGVRVIERK